LVVGVKPLYFTTTKAIPVVGRWIFPISKSLGNKCEFWVFGFSYNNFIVGGL